jgi:hypothetical protein
LSRHTAIEIEAKPSLDTHPKITALALLEPLKTWGVTPMNMREAPWLGQSLTFSVFAETSGVGHAVAKN